MSQYGIKIKNYEMASLYEYYYGFRNYPDMTDAMLTNSLFKDFLVENGLNVYKGESTRDIICLAFSYKTKSYADMIKKQLSEEIINNINNNIDKCIEIKKERLREMAYREGVTIRYKNETIHYKMLYRSTGKAKQGTCMFIRDSLYEKAHEFLTMGIGGEVQIVKMAAYSSLIASSIIAKIRIEPGQVLVLKDIDSYVTTNATLIKLDENKHCITEHCDNHRAKNTIFDGQALIDSSIFPDWADGYILLRNHMTKCAAFNTNIALFMHEHFGADYDNATVKDMWGRDVKVSDIKLICTESVMKWLSFNVSFDYWAEWVRKNDCQWGIVKTTHESKLGDVQRMSYQMINALDLDTMPEVTAKSVNYIDKLKKDDVAFLDYLQKNANFVNDFDALLALVEHNPDFVRSSYFRDRKRKIIEAYVLNFKSGRVIQNADNLTIVGSPYAMLLQSVGEDVENDPTFQTENDSIQCWTERFKNNEYLAEFRSPFNSRNNLGYLHNVYHPFFDRYFKLGKLCIAVNMQHTTFQDRNNGSDMDSDSIYTTNQPDIVIHARRCYQDYPTIVNLIPQDKNKYPNTPMGYAKLDNILASSQFAIGESSNLAQLALTYTYNFPDVEYQDAVCILSVVAQVAIDSAKRKYDLDIPSEIRYIKDVLKIKVNGLPYFWQIVKKDKRKARTNEIRNQRRAENKAKILKHINPLLVCPMNSIYAASLTKYRTCMDVIPFEDFLIPYQGVGNRRKNRKVEEMIEKYMFDLNSIEIDGNYDEEKISLLMSNFDQLITDIRTVGLSSNYQGLMLWLINRAFRIPEQTKNSNSKLYLNKSVLLKTLYEVNPKCFLSCFVHSSDNKH